MTFLLTDIPGTAQGWETDPDTTSARLAVFDDVVADIARRHRGVLAKPRGENDSHFLAFVEPADAVAAAIALTVAAKSHDLALRQSISTGYAELREGDYYGAIVNRTARFRSAAHPGQVVLGEPAVQAIRALPDGATLKDLGWHWLKDLETPQRAYELVHPSLVTGHPPLTSLAPPAATNLPLPLTSFVGRDDDIDTIVAAILARPSVLTITGAPGVGKSRLAAEVAVAAGRRGQTLVRLVRVRQARARHHDRTGTDADSGRHRQRRPPHRRGRRRHH